MTNPVAADDIERIVGVSRHWIEHWGRAVSAERRLYILHSEVCLVAREDLRTCPFSVALDRGISMEDWGEFEDMPVRLAVYRFFEAGERLVPDYYMVTMSNP